MIEIWHNARCSKSRAALALLEAEAVEHRVRRYLDEPPSAAELDDVLVRLGLEPWELVRTGEPEHAELGMRDWGRDPASDRVRWVSAMAANPRLIERPIVVAGERAVVGRPTQAVQDLLDG